MRSHFRRQCRIEGRDDHRADRARYACRCTAMWLAALAGRLAFLVHGASGHAVTWKASSLTSSTCPGDIVCHECGQVLWCRAHDPWRGSNGEAPDHWGGTRGTEPAMLFDSLQHVLRLAEACPAGPSGDAIRRAACELVEAGSSSQRTASRRRMLKCVAQVQGRSRDRSRMNHPSSPMLRELADALRRERWER